MAMGPYVDSQWGLAHFSLPNESPCVCAFIGDRKSVVGKYGAWNYLPLSLGLEILWSSEHGHQCVVTDSCLVNYS